MIVALKSGGFVRVIKWWGNFYVTLTTPLRYFARDEFDIVDPED